jgi:hypothetical protein
MSVSRLWNLEGRVERLWQAVLLLRQEVQDLAQKLWQLAGHGGGQGGGGDVPAIMTATMSAGSTTTPATTTGNLMIPNGSGGLTTGAAITIQSYYTMSFTVSGSKFCWVQQDTQTTNYNLKVADC